ncbi:putative RNA polymerase II subunit B1 CTD phosphatase RPAP2-like protein [Drosera capensis]
MGQKSAEVEEIISVSDCVHKLQLYLLDGIHDENQLFAAGSLLSRSDYEDAVTERSIVKSCGYPLCRNSLSSDKQGKGRYRIALKEHRVYDLQEASLYCSTGCAINSRAFAESLQNKRCSVLDSVKLNEIMRLFEGVSLNSGVDLGKDGDLGLKNLQIQEKANVKGGEVTFADWIGPPNAIEGYVSGKDRSATQPNGKGARSKKSVQKKGKGSTFSDTNFSSVIMMQDEYNSWKEPVVTDRTVTNQKGQGSEGMDQLLSSKGSSTATKTEPQTVSNPTQIESIAGNNELPTVEAESSKTSIKPARKSSGAKKAACRSVTWADEKNNGGNLCEIEELKNTNEVSKNAEADNGEDLERLASAKACAIALHEAAEAVASGASDVTDAVSEAGILLLPQPLVSDREECLNEDKIDPAAAKWPSKSGQSYDDITDSEDSWFGAAPEGFSLTLSPFGTMWNALFTWITSSSLAYIYGRDEGAHLEYLSVNGVAYPQKIVLAGERSSEIKQTLAGCLARTLPDVFEVLKVPTPVYAVHHGLRELLDTMTFVDALPPFRTKQWHVIVLLFVDALTVCRLPGLQPFWTTRRMLIPKVLEGSKITPEDYNFMLDFIIPLGREPPTT